MSLQLLLPWVIGAIAISIAAMVSGAWSALPPLVTAGALSFGLVMVATCWHINRPWLASTSQDVQQDDLALAVRRNARLLAYVYVWGGLALYALYKGTSLRWQHGHQYAIGMAVIGFVIIGWVHHSWRSGSPLTGPLGLKLALRAAMLHAGAAVGGLVFLIGSGKLLSAKGDWAANQVFLAGGLAVVGISIIAIRTHLHLERIGSGDAAGGAAAPEAANSS